MEFQELQQIVESNSRSIQTLADRIAGLALVQKEAAEERAELRAATLGIANLLASLDSDRPTILRKLNTIEDKVDRLQQRTVDGGSF